MPLLELTQNEMNSLKAVLEAHEMPCFDCSPELDCAVYKRGLCLSKNIETIITKIKEIEK